MKLLSISLLLLMLALVGCGPTESKSASNAGDGAKTDRPPLKVGIVFDEGGRGDKSFNDSAWAGIEQAEKELGIEPKVIESKFAKDYETNQAALAEAGMDIVFVIGASQQEALRKVAGEHPDTKFALVDGNLEAPNVLNLNFTEEQGSFLAGYLAGLVTKTNKIGFVGGMNIPLITKFEVGYIAGAKTANPDVTVLPSKFTESWADVSLGKSAAQLLFSQGADIVYHAAGRSGLGVIDAAKEADKLAIGVDGNQDDLAPGNVLTSMVKHVDVSVVDTIKELIAGTFAGGSRVYNLADGGVGLTEFAHTRDLIGAQNLARVEAEEKKVAGGEVKVPTTKDELDAYLASLKR